MRGRRPDRLTAMRGSSRLAVPEVRARAALCVAVLAAGALVIACSTDRAAAAFPGRNGRIAFESDRTGHSEIFTMLGDGSHVRRLTTTAPSASNSTSSISADGKRVVFSSSRTGHFEIFVMRANGSHPRQLTHTAPAVYNSDASFAPDGKTVVFDRSAGAGLYQLYTVRTD